MKSLQDDDSSSDEDPEEAWEWRRLYLADDGGFWDLLCCPEDVVRTAQCCHETNSTIKREHVVCQNCRVPICDERYQHI